MVDFLIKTENQLSWQTDYGCLIFYAKQLRINNQNPVMNQAKSTNIADFVSKN